MRALAALVALALAGCTVFESSGGDRYPDDYMLATYGVPFGFQLVPADSELGALIMPEFGMDTNPGEADPASFEDEEEPGPVPEAMYVALYQTEDFDLWAGEGTVIFSMALTMADAMDADELADDEDVCEDEDGVTIVLRDDLRFAMLAAFGQRDMRTALETVSDQIQDATGALVVCS